MRKFKILFVASLIVLVLAACGSEQTPATPQIIRETVEVVVEKEVEKEVEVTVEVETVVEKEVVVVEEVMVEGEAVEVVVLPAVNPIDFSGDIAMAGSSTVFPLAERMKERFEEDGFGGNITVDSIGSGGGFERFCVEGESDISNASRPIKDSEVEQCAAIGRTPIEFRVGTDALAVVVSQENDFAQDVTAEELAAIFSTASTWADVRADWPAEPIQRFIPGTDSGTFDYFVEEVFDEDEAPILAADNLELSEDDNVLVQGAIGSPYAIAFFGYAYYQENADVVRPLSIDGVEPSQESVDAAEYPLARPLFIYSDAGIIAEKPQVGAFINFFLSTVNDEIGDVGYFPAGVGDLNMAKLAFADSASMAGSAMDDGMMEDDSMAMVDPIEFSGDIAMAGSSTVFPLAERMKERFEGDGFGGNITVDSIGSGGGFERFCVEGESDISNASRPIKDSEVEQCAEIGRTPIEFRVGTDALAVVVSSENDFAQDVTLEELAAIFSSAENWSDVRADWPAEPIQRFIPGTDSGTFDYFVEEVFDEDEAPILAASNLELSEDDNVLVQGATGSPYAVAFFGYAYYQENADVVRPLSIDGVEPSQESVDAATYPLARPLYIYSDASIMDEKPQVRAFVTYFLQHVNEEITDVGYFPAGADDLQMAMDALHGGGDTMMSEGVMLEAIDPIAYSGDIAMAGSSTVFPLAERMKERFEGDGFGGNITVDSIGSGGGFERFCVEGESDISNASRPIKDSEVEQCAAIGRTPIEFRVGTDALAVVVSSENDFAQDVTLEELAAIFSSAENWSDVRADWPTEPIQRFIPGTDSGTFDYFVEEVFDEDEAPILAASNLELSEDDNVLVQGATGSRYAIAFFGYAYYQENADVVRPLSIDGVEPSQESVDAAEYPLARPLFIYSDAGIIAEKPQVGAFISYFLSNVNAEIDRCWLLPSRSGRP